MGKRELNQPKRMDMWVEAEEKEALKKLADSLDTDMTTLVRMQIRELIEMEDIKVKKDLPQAVSNGFKILDWIEEHFRLIAPKESPTRFRMKTRTVALLIGKVDYGSCKKVVELATEILMQKGLRCVFVEDVQPLSTPNKRIVIEKLGFIIECEEPVSLTTLATLIEEARQDYEQYGKIVRMIDYGQVPDAPTFE